MPFGKYADMADCIAQNQDKASPEGFCAWLHKQITGSWPSDMSETMMPAGAWEVFLSSYGDQLDKGVSEKDAAEIAFAALSENGWQKYRQGYVHVYEAPKMKTVTGVKVFAPGKWTDSMGEERDWTTQDMLAMVEAFNAGIPSVVPLKAGHTSDTFNTIVAEELGVPLQLIEGEMGSGQISLGRMASLELRGDLLIASFERVPQAVADLIEGGQFSTVSAEIEEGVGEFKTVMTGVALLGAERPAVDSATLERAMVFHGGARDGARVLMFTADMPTIEDFEKKFAELGGMFDSIKGRRGAPDLRALYRQLNGLLKRMTSGIKDHSAIDGVEPTKHQEVEIMEELTAIATALGLGEGATVEEMVAAIGALRSQVEASEPKMQAEFTAVNARVATLEEQNRKLEFNARVMEWEKITSHFTSLEGKPEDMALNLAEIERDAGKETADKVCTSMLTANDTQQKALKIVGSEARVEDGTTHPFEEKITKYQEEHGVTRQVAMAKLTREDPNGWAEYRQSTIE